MKSLRISKTLSLPLDFVTNTQGILAKKGKGKSYLAGVQAEELLELGQQVVVVDPTGAWWGLRSSADGKSDGYSIAVLGGEHADVPIEATAGEVIADAIASEHFSAVIDLTLFRKGESLRFMAAFLETLYRKNRHALHMFIDEADFVAPQKTFSPEAARALGATEDIVRRGRIRGIGCTLITQRPQVLNKDVLSQVDMLTTLGMNHPRDLGAIADWVAVHGDPKQAAKMNESLPALPLGDAWFWAPSANIFERVTVRKKRTFDSGKTPKAGERVITPKVIARVDLERLGSAIAATVQRVKADDPKVLRARIAELEKASKSKAPIAPVERVVEREVMNPKLVASLKDTIGRIEHRTAALDDLLRECTAELGQAKHMLQLREAALIAAARRPAPQPAPRVPAARATSSTPHTSNVGGACGRAILEALASRHPTPLTLMQLATLAGYSPSSSTFDNSRGALRSAGLIEYGSRHIVITDAGLAEVGPRPPAKTGTELLELWATKLPKREVQILEAAARANSHGLAKQELADTIGMSITSSSFDNYVGHLHSNGLLVKGDDGRERIAEELIS